MGTRRPDRIEVWCLFMVHSPLSACPSLVLLSGRRGMQEANAVHWPGGCQDQGLQGCPHPRSDNETVEQRRDEGWAKGDAMAARMCVCMYASALWSTSFSLYFRRPHSKSHKIPPRSVGRACAVLLRARPSGRARLLDLAGIFNPDERRQLCCPGLQRYRSLGRHRLP